MKVNPEWHWRTASLKSDNHEYRLLVQLRTDKPNQKAWLIVKFAEGWAMVARLESHFHSGLHCHAECAEGGFTIGEIEPAGMVAFPYWKSFHRRPHGLRSPQDWWQLALKFSPNRGEGLPDMNIERRLCEAFCDGLTVEKVAAGFAVATPFEDAVGDRLAFYVIPDTKKGFYRLEDDGALVPTLIAMGTDVTEGQRARLFRAILNESDIEFDSNRGELRTAPLSEDAVPMAAIRFVSMLTRVAALSAMRPELVMNTFREDAIRRIRDELSDKLVIEERKPVSPALAEFEPDLLLHMTSWPPVAVFIAVSDARLYEAIFLRLAADYEAPEHCSVVALIEREDTRLVSNRMRQRAHNRLDAVPVYYGEESAAIARIAREAIPDFRETRPQ